MEIAISSHIHWWGSLKVTAALATTLNRPTQLLAATDSLSYIGPNVNNPRISVVDKRNQSTPQPLLSLTLTTTDKASCTYNLISKI
jgi:hypothetical protein